VVVLFASVAAMSGVPILARGHPVILGLWFAFVTFVFVYGMKLLVDLKKQGL
jgi:hypothetical protein